MRDCVQRTRTAKAKQDRVEHEDPWDCMCVHCIRTAKDKRATMREILLLHGLKVEEEMSWERGTAKGSKMEQSCVGLEATLASTPVSGPAILAALSAPAPAPDTAVPNTTPDHVIETRVVRYVAPSVQPSPFLSHDALRALVWPSDHALRQERHSSGSEFLESGGCRILVARDGRDPALALAPVLVTTNRQRYVEGEKDGGAQQEAGRGQQQPSNEPSGPTALGRGCLLGEPACYQRVTENHTSGRLHSHVMVDEVGAWLADWARFVTFCRSAMNDCNPHSGALVLCTGDVTQLEPVGEITQSPEKSEESEESPSP